MEMWRLRLTVRDDAPGEIVMSDGVPPGEYEVRGHDDGNRAVIIVRQQDSRGRFVATACHRRDRAEELGETSLTEGELRHGNSHAERLERLRETAQRVSRLLDGCPESEEKARAEAALRDAVTWGNAAISKGE